MKHIICGIKGASDSALWLGIICGILSFYYDFSNLILIVPVAFLFSFIGSLLSKKGFLRLSAIFLLTPVILFVKSNIDLIAVVPLICYLIFCLCRNILYPEYMVLEDFFPKAGFIVTFMGFIMAFREIFWIFAVCLLYEVLGVFMMRILRHQEINSSKLNVIEFTLLIILCILCFLLSRPEVISIITACLGFVYRYAISPIIMLFMLILYGFVWVLSKIGTLFIRTKDDTDTSGFGNSIMGLTEDALKGLRENQGNTTIFITILRILGVIAFIGISILIIKWFLGSMKKTGTEKEIEYNKEESFHFDTRFDDSLKFLDKSPKAKVRRAYHEFIKAALDLGVPITLSDTTLDINQSASSKIDISKANELREIYLSARYNPDAEPTAAEIKTAKLLSKSLQREIKDQLRTIRKGI